MRASSGRFRRNEIAEIDIPEGLRALVGDDAHHLLRCDPVGAQRGDERAGRGAYVDVELVDRAICREQVERAQRSDLIYTTGKAATAQHQRRLVAARAAAF